MQGTWITLYIVLDQQREFDFNANFHEITRSVVAGSSRNYRFAFAHSREDFFSAMHIQRSGFRSRSAGCVSIWSNDLAFGVLLSSFEFEAELKSSWSQRVDLFPRLVNAGFDNTRFAFSPRRAFRRVAREFDATRSRRRKDCERLKTFRIERGWKFSCFAVLNERGQVPT